jgi:hypothetical protein
MLRKRKQPKSKKSVAEVLLQDVQGTAAEKLALFEKLKARRGFAGQDRAEVFRVERVLWTFASTGEVIDRLRTSAATRKVEGGGSEQAGSLILP